MMLNNMDHIRSECNDENKCNNQMSLRIIGITGEAGSGKTTITKAYARLKNGYYILTDDVAREMMEPYMECYDKVVEHFGKDILNKDDTIDRAKLAQIVFNNTDELNILNNLVHGAVVDKVKDIIKHIKSLNNANKCGKIYSVVLIESAILFQVKELVDMCHEIWYVETDDEKRRSRLKRERNYSDERIDSMSISQESVRLAKGNCNKIIINDRDIKELNELLKTL